MSKKILVPIVITFITFLFLTVSNISVLSIASSPEGLQIITSPYISKIGILAPIFGQSTDSTTDMYNSLISNFYGYLILETPVKLDSNTKEKAVELLKRFNEDAMDGETKDFFPNPIFSDKLISLVEKNSYEIADLETLNKELSQSMTTFCNGISAFEKTGGLEKESFTPTITNFCKNYKGNIFTKQGSKYILNLPNLDIYGYEYAESCELKQLSTGDTPISVCMIQRGNLVKKGEIKLSNINLQISESAGHIFIGLHNQAIIELDNLPPRFDFAQLGFYVDSKNNSNLGNEDILRKAAYFIFSNNDEVIKASNGEIDKTNRFQDLIFALKERKLFKSPTQTANFGVAFLISLGVGGVSYYFTNRKKKLI